MYAGSLQENMSQSLEVVTVILARTCERVDMDDLLGNVLITKIITLCSVSIRYLALAGHFHWKGRLFRMWPIDGRGAEKNWKAGRGERAALPLVARSVVETQRLFRLSLNLAPSIHHPASHTPQPPACQPPTAQYQHPSLQPSESLSTSPII